MRTTLDSDNFHNWLDKKRSGNRVLFGRYTGLTPVSGRLQRWNSEEGVYEPNEHAIERLRERLIEIEAESSDIIEEVRQGRLEEEVRYYFQNICGGEMWSRWDMQETPPDILGEVHPLQDQQRQARVDGHVRPRVAASRRGW